MQIPLFVSRFINWSDVPICATKTHMFEAIWFDCMSERARAFLFCLHTWMLLWWKDISDKRKKFVANKLPFNERKTTRRQAITYWEKVFGTLASERASERVSGRRIHAFSNRFTPFPFGRAPANSRATALKRTLTRIHTELSHLFNLPKPRAFI